MYQLEKKIEAISSNNNSPTPQISSSIMPLLTSIQSQISSGFAETLEAVSALRDRSENDVPVVDEDTYRLFSYSGGFHKIPEGYKFTVTTLKEFWNLYFLGVPALHFRPLRMLSKKDFLILNMKNIYKNVFSNGCCVMKTLGELLMSEGLIENIKDLNNVSPDESNRLFVEAYKKFINKYCGGIDTKPTIGTAYKKILESNKSTIAK